MGVFLPGDLAKRLDRPAPGGHTFPGLSTELRILFGSPNGVTLKLLIFSAVALACPCYGQQRPAPSAEDVFASFCKIDAQGGQLTADGWQKIAALFMSPGTPRRGRIIVIDGGGQLRPTREGEKIDVGREYIRFGQIDLPKLRFSVEDGLPHGIKVKEDFSMVKTVGPKGAEEWRIEGLVPEPHFTVDAAIRYVTEVRGNTKDATTKKNADRTLAALNHFR